MAEHGIAPLASTGTARLDVRHQRRGSAVLVRFTGEVDLHSADVMREALTAALAGATPPHPVVLDLTGVGFFGSNGLSALLEARQHALDHGTPLRIVATSRTVLRPIEITGMAGILDIRRTITTALAPAHDPPPHTDPRHPEADAPGPTGRSARSGTA
jgi:anti-sigma B factor antagonist